MTEARKLNLENNQFYPMLLGNLYLDEDNHVALEHFGKAKELALSPPDKDLIQTQIDKLKEAEGLF